PNQRGSAQSWNGTPLAREGAAFFSRHAKVILGTLAGRPKTVPSRAAINGIARSRKRAVPAIIAIVPLLIATSFAQAPAYTPNSVSTAQASSPGYLDPLPQD